MEGTLLTNIYDTLFSFLYSVYMRGPYRSLDPPSTFAPDVGPPVTCLIPPTPPHLDLTSMLCLGRARLKLFFNLPKAPASLRPFSCSCSSPSTVSTTTVSLPRHALSTIAVSQNDIFNYMSGRWGVSLVHSVLSYLTRNLNLSAITTLFATKSGGSLSISTGYVDSQPSLSTKLQMM